MTATCPACHSVELVDVLQLRFDHTNDCTIRAAEDARIVADVDVWRAGTGGSVTFDRPVTVAERELLRALGIELPAGAAPTRLDRRAPRRRGDDVTGADPGGSSPRADAEKTSGEAALHSGTVNVPPLPGAQGASGAPQRPAAPAGTGPRGEALWRSLTEMYALEEHELAILRDAVGTVDLVERLAAVLAVEGPVIDSPQGRKAHPAAVEVRQQRLALARLLSALRVPQGEDGDHQASARTPRRAGVRGVYGVGARS